MTEVIAEELNMKKPALPDELLRFPLDEIDIMDFPDELERIWSEVFEELYSHKWPTHNIATYNRGCRGPLCKKAVRQDGRRKQNLDETAAERTFRRLDPIIEYYGLIAWLRIRDYRRAKLLAIKAS